jgi:uncharacterized protein with FMN-binding domain
MSRIVLWCLSTLSVLVLLFGYHTSTSSTLASGAPSSYRSGTVPGVKTATTSSSGSTVTGPEVDTQWGPVQVEITVSGGKITDVAVPVSPNGNPKDVEINNYALPVLVQETLDQQSASIDMVSGATVTSTGYLQSLQSALDEAGL